MRVNLPCPAHIEAADWRRACEITERQAQKATRGLPPWIDGELVRAEAWVYLWKAAQAFRPGSRARFSSFANIKVWGGLIQTIRDVSPLTRREYQDWKAGATDIASPRTVSLDAPTGETLRARLESLPAPGPGPEGLVLGTGVAGPSSVTLSLLALVDRLPDDERTALLRRYDRNETLQEIATATGCYHGTVSKRLARAQEQLQRERLVLPAAGPCVVQVSALYEGPPEERRTAQLPPGLDARSRYLITHYHTKTAATMAAELGIAVRTTQKRLAQLRERGLLILRERAYHPPWLPEEFDWARRVIGTEGWSISSVAARLERTENAVILKLHKAGIARPCTRHADGSLHLQGVMDCLGITSHHRVRQWLREGTLAGTQLPGSIWNINLEAVVDFVRNHPEAYDYDRIPARLPDGTPNPCKAHARRESPTAGYLSLKQVARQLGLKVKQVRHLVYRGRIPQAAHLAGAGIHPQEWFVPKALLQSPAFRLSVVNAPANSRNGDQL